MKRSISVSSIHAAARKALIAADAGYFSWPEQQQERFRATMNEQAQSRALVTANPSGHYQQLRS